MTRRHRNQRHTCPSEPATDRPPPTHARTPVSLSPPSGTAIGFDGETEEFNRKFFAFEASDRYKQSRRRDDSALNREADAYFKKLDEAQRSPETIRNFFWYLMNRDISDFDPHDFPSTPLMDEMLAELNVLPRWFAAWSSGSWTPPSPAMIDDLDASFVGDGLYKTTILEEIFRLWASTSAPSQVGLPDFDKAIAKFAKSNPEKLMYTRTSSTRGYKMLLSHFQSNSSQFSSQQQ